MEDLFDANWRERFHARHAGVEAELASLIDVRGGSLVEQPEQLQLLLTQACPDAPRHIAALLVASRVGVAARLRGASDDAALPGLLQRSARDLLGHGIDDPDWAWWAVRTWAHAFALPTSTAARPAAAPVATRPPFAPWRDTPAAAPVASAPTMSRPTAATTPAPAPPLPVASPPPVAPPRDAGRVVERREPAFEAVDAPVEGRAAATVEAPLADLRPAMERPRSRRPLMIAASIVVPLVLVIGWFALSRHGTPTTASSPAIEAPVATRPSTDAGPSSAAETDERVIAANAAATQAPTTAAPAAVGDATKAGDASGASIDTAKPAAAPPDVVMTPKPLAAPTVVDTVKPAPVGDTANPAVAPPATPPVARAAPPTTAPAIARIDVPRVADGVPFTVVLRLSTDARDIVGVERRFVASDGAWPRYGTATAGSGMRRSGSLLSIPFRGVEAPARATIEFVAIDRDGRRSEPKLATIAVAASAGAGPPTTDACSPTTCGTVVESSEVDRDAGSRGAVYRVVVRMDDGRTHAFTVPYRLQTGLRARMIGGRLVPAGAASF